MSRTLLPAAALSRRELFAGAAAWAVAPKQVRPDLILHRGNVFTIDPDVPRAEAIAIAGDRVFAVGSDDEVLGLATSSTRRIDLGGRTVVPGFIDAHSHPGSSGFQHLFNVDCDLRSIPSIQDALREAAAEKAAGEWVLGFKYDDTKTAEGRPLTLDDLDGVSTEHPIYVVHRGGHTGYVNRRALEVAGVTQQTPDPEGGHYDRDARGQLTGKLEETALQPFRALTERETSPEAMRRGVELISRMMTKAGVTSVTDAFGSPNWLRAYQEVASSGAPSLRVYCHIGYTFLDDMIEAGIRTGLGDERVRVGAVKMTCDGSISERTARLSEPYVGRPEDFGILVMPEDQLFDISNRAHRNGWQLAIHANGDVGIDIALRIFERLQREAPRADPRFRLEHCTVINDDLVRRIAALGAIPNPFSTYVYYHGEKMKEYGAARLEHMFAVRSFLDAGIRVTQTSDYPPGPYEPMMALQSQVTRTDMNGNTWGPSQKISVEEALRVGTLHGAYASYEEDLKGSLTPGKLADLVVLAEDPTEVDPMRLIDIEVERTMIGGRWAYES